MTEVDEKWSNEHSGRFQGRTTIRATIPRAITGGCHAPASWFFFPTKSNSAIEQPNAPDLHIRSSVDHMGRYELTNGVSEMDGDPIMLHLI
ncbi:hypothetical protein AVEN_206189-1 [Araneus ventricosus]|uniref:Uncharacterized protein n=1 Tax=Araneus ventricosus TaxID=182803 RepID=A0A4Y2EBR3_ARAVE|nr:hypothetical protein AVEN_206189-1 [Araneus ventricosus]